MKKLFILDTNVLLSSSVSLFKFDEHDVIIPISVIEEMDRFKKDFSDVGRNARMVSRHLDTYRETGSLSEGVPIFPGNAKSGSIFVEFARDLSALPLKLDNNVDNQILSIALRYTREFPERKTILVTKDINLRIKADAFNVLAEDFEADKVARIDEMYTGFTELEVSSSTITDFISNQRTDISQIEHQFFANQFVRLTDETNNTNNVLGKFNLERNEVTPLLRAPEGLWSVHPRNEEQLMAIDLLLNDDLKLVSLMGGAGTGKTLLAVAAGLVRTCDDNIYKKMLISRPVFPMGRDLGYLPGDINEKLNPWMQPIYDNLDLIMETSEGKSQTTRRQTRGYQELINQGMVEVEPLTYIRGRSIPHVYLIVDEAQNLTSHEMKTILTRAGEGTKIVLTGDPYQIDNPYLDASSNGMTYVIDRFKEHAIAGHITLSHGERSALATLSAEIL